MRISELGVSRNKTMGALPTSWHRQCLCKGITWPMGTYLKRCIKRCDNALYLYWRLSQEELTRPCNPFCGCNAVEVPQCQHQQHLWHHAKLLEQLDSGKHIVTTQQNLVVTFDHTLQLLFIICKLATLVQFLARS